MTADPTEAVAREIRSRGLSAPALLLLDAHRPLRPLLGQAATFLLPLMRPLLGESSSQALERALGDDAAYDRLMERLRRGARR